MHSACHLARGEDPDREGEGIGRGVRSFWIENAGVIEPNAALRGRASAGPQNAPATQHNRRPACSIVRNSISARRSACFRRATEPNGNWLLTAPGSTYEKAQMADHCTYDPVALALLALHPEAYTEGDEAKAVRRRKKVRFTKAAAERARGLPQPLEAAPARMKILERRSDVTLSIYWCDAQT